jgi:hypothetical protein
MKLFSLMVELGKETRLEREMLQGSKEFFNRFIVHL